MRAIIIVVALSASAAFWAASPAQAMLTSNGLYPNAIASGLDVNNLTVRSVTLPVDPASSK